MTQSIDGFVFDTDTDRKRYMRLIEELRCPQCVNTNLAGSDAPIATDLRKTVFSLMGEGKTDHEIRTYLRERYGEFILFNPRVTPATLLLWGAPIILVLIAIWTLLGVREKREEITLSLSDHRRIAESRDEDP